MSGHPPPSYAHRGAAPWFRVVRGPRRAPSVRFSPHL